MTTLTVNITDEKDLPVIKEILTRFGLDYDVSESKIRDKQQETKLYKKLKKSFTEIKEWEAGKIKLQNAHDAIGEIEAELKNEI